MEKFDEAIQDYSEAIRLDSRDDYAYGGRAMPGTGRKNSIMRSPITRMSSGSIPAVLVHTISELTP